MLYTTWFCYALLICCVKNHLAARRYGFENRIVGGVETTIAHVPYLINLRLGGQFICGGSLLTSSCVLTAAHCVYGMEPSSLSINGGASKLSDQAPIVRAVASSYLSPFYQPATLDMDVAILRLSEPVSMSAVSTIQLCEKTPADNSFVKITGWGIIKEDSPAPADQVRTANVRVVTKRECIRSYRGKAKLTSTMFCASVPGVKDSCSGDSGGPVVQNGRVCGIVSWGFGCARAEYPGVYTNVASIRVRGFIREILDEYCT